MIQSKFDKDDFCIKGLASVKHKRVNDKSGKIEKIQTTQRDGTVTNYELIEK
jgi:hypothetical protein